MEWLVSVLLFGSGAAVAVLVGRLSRRPWLTARGAVPGPRWQVRCRDGAGRSDELLVSVQNHRIVLHARDGRLVTFAPLEAGALRGALREAAHSPAATATAGSHRHR